MPLTLAHLLADTKPLTLALYGDTLNLKYAPTAVSTKTIRLFARIETLPDVDKAETVTRLVSDIVRGWDLQDRDGGVVGLDRDSVSELPIQFLMDVLRGILEDISVKKTTAPKPALTSHARYVKKGR